MMPVVGVFVSKSSDYDAKMPDFYNSFDRSMMNRGRSDERVLPVN